jgi:hypothetical protein
MESHRESHRLQIYALVVAVIGIPIGLGGIGFAYWQSRSPSVTSAAIELPTIAAEVAGSSCRSSEHEANASLELGHEITRASDPLPFLQCGSAEDPALARGTYEFPGKALPSESNPTSLEAKVGVDEQSVGQEGTTARWRLVYDGDAKCETPSVKIRHPYHWVCNLRDRIGSDFDLDLLSIVQIVHPATTDHGHSLWAGLLDPTLNYEHQ